MPKYVYDFSEGNRDLKDLLGGKGANLAEMTNLGLPVPPGFTITTEACNVYLETGYEPDELAREVSAHLAALEKAMGKALGQADDPLLVSVRSGAKFSMPGMMDTVLNIGLNDESVDGLAKQAGSERFAWDSYRRLIQMFGKTVLGVDGEHFDDVFDAAKARQGRHQRPRPRRRRPARDRRAATRRSSPSTPAGVPERPARAARPRRTRGLRLLERRPRQALPPPGADPRRPRHRGQRRRDGLRQHRHGLRHRRRVHPRPGHAATRASTATTCRTRRARTSSPASATPSRSPSSRTSTSRRTTS